MKKVILALALGFMAVATQAQDPNAGQPVTQQKQANPNAPKIVFEQTTINYGTIEHGANGTRVFKFTNEGKEPLILNSVRPSCGCTTPKWSRDPIAPGETGEIVVRYDTKRQGSFHKTITVKSNAGNHTIVLTIKGKVLPKAKPAQTTPTKNENGGSKISR